MRSRSLFWTFAGAFLLVLVAGTLLQLAISVAVLQPLALQRLRDRAQLALEKSSRDLALAGAGATRATIAQTLHADRMPDAGTVLVFAPAGGGVYPDRRLAPEALSRIAYRLAIAGLVDTNAVKRERPGALPSGVTPGDRRDGAFPPPEGGPPPGPPGGGAFPPPDGGPPPEGGPPPGAPGEPGAIATPGRGGAPPPPGAGPSDPPEALAPGDPRPPYFELIDRREVRANGALLGVVAVLGPRASLAFWREPESRAVLLFLPLALLAAALAGLLMVRILVRRLSALERVTARVTGGDLDARVETSGTDEIGRLERSFNLMTERLAAARARLERDDAQRRQLLADITHELATPLTSIRGYLETLTNPAVPKTAEEHATFLGDALAETARLDRMIGELFDLARLEARAQPLQPVRLDWSALNRNATRRYEARFREAGLTLRWEGEPREAWIVADGRRMEQVIDNLLGNALRYVPRGGTVTCALEVAGPGPEALHRLTVADDGPGVDPAGLPHLFERFFRADSSRANGGTGLGLAIVREIVAQHGGHAYAAARAPHGVAFVIELPAGA